MGPRFTAKTIAVIGTGPSGLAAAKFLLEEQAFDKIDVFEQRSTVGGLWNYTENREDGMFSVPQTNAHVNAERPIDRYHNNAQFISPIYERLETNIPHSLMRFSNLPFPEDVQLFPRHEQVQQYLEVYAQDVSHLISFDTQVLDVRATPPKPELSGVAPDPVWDVETEHLTTHEILIRTYDAVIVANGHFSTIHIPDIHGASEWNLCYPGSISHSKYYRLPEEYVGKKVIVVGNSASGLDISSQLASVVRAPVLLSQKSESYLAGGFSQNPNIETVPQIVRLNGSDKTIYFADGRVERDVDNILFCTGYLYTFPFLRNLCPDPVGNGSRIEHTYQHLFYAPIPSLSFMALLQKVIPFPLAEAQAAAVSLVYSGRLGLPSKEEMEQWEAMEIENSGDGGDFHTLIFPKDVQYINMLIDWAACADERGKLEEGGRGKLPKRWEGRECWVRENFPAIRKAFVQRGEKRVNVTTLEDLGFDFEKREVILKSHADGAEISGG